MVKYNEKSASLSPLFNPIIISHSTQLIKTNVDKYGL